MYDPEQVLTCPFEASHRIRRCILQMHLTKCAKNHPKTTKVRCVFDPTHLIETVELSHHTTVCPSNGYVMNTLYNWEPSKELGTVSLTDSCATMPFISSENWSTDNPTYDPWKATENKNVLRVSIGLSKAQRKEHKVKERFRLANLENSGVCRSIEIGQTDNDQKPLRVPKKPPVSASFTEESLPSTSQDMSLEVESLISKLKKVFPEGQSSNKKKVSVLEIPGVLKTNSEDEKNTSASSNDSGKHKFKSAFLKNDSNDQKNHLKEAHQSIDNFTEKITISKDTYKEEVLSKSIPESHDLSFESDHFSVKTEETVETARSLDLETSLRQNPRCAAKFFNALKGAKKISTGRGITVTYDNIRYKRAQNRNDDSLDGYGEEEELELEFHDFP